jgi:hypothetical protein
VFYFQQLLEQGTQAIERTAMLPTLIGIGYTILLISFLVGLYQSAMRGGDFAALAAGSMKYLAVAIILANWGTVFHDVNGSFNQVAGFIADSSGGGDMFLSWMDQLKDQFSTAGSSALLPSISASMAAVVTALLCLAAYLIYAVMVVVFAFFYVLYGCLLYVLGPIVLALLPIAGVGQLARSYAINLMVWNAWGILYATFGALITAIQFNRVDQVVNQGFLIGFFQGSADSAVLGLVSVFYALAIGLIPFIAKRLVSGDVGSTTYSLVRAGSAALGALLSGAAGFAAGAGTGAETGAGLASSPGGVSPGGAQASAATISSSCLPPPQPSLAESIRGGMRSVVNGATAPGGSAGIAQGEHDQSRGMSQPLRPSSGSSSSSRGGFRPSGPTQILAFHAGRYAGRMLTGSG